MPGHFDLQPLEPRRFLSVTPAVHFDQHADHRVECPEVIQARAELEQAARQLRQDKRSGQATTREIQSAIRAEYQELIEEQGADAVQQALAPLREKLREDTRLKNKALRAAAEELRIAKRQGRQLLAADLEALREATASGDESAIDAARQKLEADRGQIQENLKPLRDGIEQIKAEKRALLKADHDAIQAALEALHPGLAPLYDQLDAHAAALEAKLQADVATVTDAGENLRQAIQDCREEHAQERQLA